MRLPFSKKDSNVIELPKPFSSHCEFSYNKEEFLLIVCNSTRG